MAEALRFARHAAAQNEVPVGAVIVYQNRVVAGAGNTTLTGHDPTAHAEISAIRQACQRAESQRLPDHDLYVTLEPCAMCAAAISFARIRRLYIAVDDPKGGAVLHNGRYFDQADCHHAPQVYTGFRETEARELLLEFFRARR